MPDLLPQTPEWDEPALDDDTKPMTADMRFRVERVRAAQQHDSALLDAIEREETSEALILFTWVALSHALADRLKKILEPEDIEADGGGDERSPRCWWRRSRVI